MERRPMSSYTEIYIIKWFGFGPPCITADVIEMFITNRLDCNWRVYVISWQRG